MLSSLDASLKRLGLEYVDIFYHHRPDPDTPLEETMQALADAVRMGKALYVGISNYNAEDTVKAAKILAELRTPCVIHQMRYSMLTRENEPVLEALDGLHIGSIAFSPLAQGLLTGKYINGIPADSRAKSASVFLTEKSITPDVVEKTKKLKALADKRGQTLAQMALAWDIREGGGTTGVIIGARTTTQIEENLKATQNMRFTQEELKEIDAITCYL
jgi:L-glyceraldehyde 3-phosphate reductase